MFERAHRVSNVANRPFHGGADKMRAADQLAPIKSAGCFDGVNAGRRFALPLICLRRPMSVSTWEERPPPVSPREAMFWLTRLPDMSREG